MKEIRAYIKPHKLEDVTLALHHIENLGGMTVADARGFGRARRQIQHETGEDAVDYRPYVRLEIVCGDEIVDAVLKVIQASAHTGLRGDGKIYVFPVEQAVRISTGERGSAAV